MSAPVRSGYALEATGVVVILDDASLVAHVSDRCDALVGAPPSALLGQPIDSVLGPEVARIAADIRAEDLARAGGWWPARLPSGRRIRVRGFVAGPGLLGLDLVPTGGPGPIAAEGNPIERVAGWNDRLLSSASSGELLTVAAEVARSRLGFDGAWVCRIEAGGHNTVMALDDPGGPDLVGQAVEATDVPPDQPRHMGRHVPFFVADLSAPSVSLVPGSPELALDGSSLLRPYPVFLDRLSSLGVRATASVPIVVAGRLWGRILVHHHEPRETAAATQSELRLLGAATGARLTELIEQEDAREQLALSRYSLRVMGSLAMTADLMEGVMRRADDLCGVCAADGAVVVIDGQVRTVGLDATPDQIESLLAIARTALEAEGTSVWSSASLGKATDAGAVAAGLLAARIGSAAEDIVVWVRSEDDRAIDWVQHQVVGDQIADDLFAGIAVRHELAVGVCAPWTTAQLAQAEALRDAVGQVQLARFDQMRQLNAELARSIDEYDAFAHAAAHDLKAPLRGIRQFAEFHLEDTADRLRPDETEQVHTIIRLAGRMQGLLDDLMTYAQVGQDGWEPRPVSLEAAVEETIELLGVTPEDAVVHVEPGHLTADPGGFGQLLLNLVGNAVKYSEGPAVISIRRSTLAETALEAEPPPTLAGAPAETPVLVVADQGIGIDPEYHEQVFGLFRQLEGTSAGTGAGLAICRLICKRQGGDLWMSSALGVGTTFYVVPQV